MHKHRLERVLVVNAAISSCVAWLRSRTYSSPANTRLPARTSRATCASAPQSASARAPRSALNAGRGRRRRDRGRYRPRPFRRRTQACAVGEEEFPAGGSDRRQHRHGQCRQGTGRSRCRWRQGRHWSRLDLHHAHRRRCRRATDHGRRLGGQCAGRQQYSLDCRWWHPLFGRHLQGDRRRRQCGDAWRPVCRYRGGSGRNRACTKGAPTRPIAAWAALVR
jgi:hypothetical protein